MVAEGTSTLVVLTRSLIDGTGTEPRSNVALTVEDGVITRVDEAEPQNAAAPVLDLREFTVLPGLINMHAHTMLPGDGTSFQTWMEMPDELLLLKAHANAMIALRSGVTTIRDCGGKGTLMFRLRDAIRAGIASGPRFVLSGRPLTITGGHCRYFGGEVDGADAMRGAARQLLKEGADFIKIMASGGGTPGAYAQFPAFETDELRAAIKEAQKIGRRASCHCIAAESITRALDAGTDHIEHCTFLMPDLTVQYDEALAQRVAEAGVFVTATLQVMGDLPPGAEDRVDRGAASSEEARQAAAAKRRVADHLATIGSLHRLGVPIVAGNDAGWRDTGFDDFYEELGYLVRAGLTPLEAIYAATGRAAQACQLEDTIGTLEPGRVADLLAVRGDPTDDVGSLRNPIVVMQRGQIVVDRREA